MEALTTEDVRDHVTPGSTVRDARGAVHSVFKVLNTGYGFAGVLLTTRLIGNGNAISYGVWVISAEGRIRCTMTSEDFAAVHGAFESRVVKMLRTEIDVLTGTEDGK